MNQSGDLVVVKCKRNVQREGPGKDPRTGFHPISDEAAPGKVPQKKRPGEEEAGNDKVVERKDPEYPSRVEILKILLLGAGIEQNPGYEKTGEYEEEVHTGPSDGDNPAVGCSVVTQARVPLQVV